MHDDAYIDGRSENNINASCMTISGGRTKQLDIFCHVTGFTSDFLSFIVVELVRFFHGAIQIKDSNVGFLLDIDTYVEDSLPTFGASII